MVILICIHCLTTDIAALQNIKMQIMSAGQEIDDSIIMKQYLLPHLNTQLIEIQTAVFEEHDVDEGNMMMIVELYYNYQNHHIIIIIINLVFCIKCIVNINHPCID